MGVFIKTHRLASFFFLFFSLCPPRIAAEVGRRLDTISIHLYSLPALAATESHSYFPGFVQLGTHAPPIPWHPKSAQALGPLLKLLCLMDSAWTRSESPWSAGAWRSVLPGGSLCSLATQCSLAALQSWDSRAAALSLMLPSHLPGPTQAHASVSLRSVCPPCNPGGGGGGLSWAQACGPQTRANELCFTLPSAN